MDLIPEKYSTEDLKTVTAQLRDKLNESGRLIDSLHINYPDDKTIFKQAAGLYDYCKNRLSFSKLF